MEPPNSIFFTFLFYSFDFQIKIQESKLRWRTPLQATGYVRATAVFLVVIKNRIFSFADMLLFLPRFPDFQHSF